MRFLSIEWFDAAASAFTKTGDVPTATIVIEQVVTGVATWQVVFRAGQTPELVRFESEATTPADARFEQSWETACAIATGNLDAHEALLLGDITFSGDTHKVIDENEAYAWMSAALKPVIAQTSFD